MKLVVISPEHDDPREHAVLAVLFAAGLERYHVRKPRASADDVLAWVRMVPAPWWPRLVLHQHHGLVDALGLGGRHWRDDGGAAAVGRPSESRAGAPVVPPITSRSCHDLATLRAGLGVYDSVFFGPVFPSLSKPGYGPAGVPAEADVGVLLRSRSAAERHTCVLAIGGITAETAPRARALGFDGVAALGAVWQASDPVAAFAELCAVVAGCGCRPAPGVEPAGANTFATLGRRPDADESASAIAARPRAV